MYNAFILLFVALFAHVIRKINFHSYSLTSLYVIIARIDDIGDQI